MKKQQIVPESLLVSANSDGAIQRRPSIAMQLLIAVNGICVVLLLLFVAYDYQQALRQRLSEKQISLQEEAMIMLSAVRDIEHHGVDSLQRFIDSVCLGMEDAHSLGHHIVVRSRDHVLQAQSHHRAGDEMLRSVESAAEHAGHRGQFQGRELIVGVARHDKLAVYVSEYIDNVRAEVIRNSLRRLGGSLALGILAAIIVNIVLLRIVVRPLERLIGIVNEVSNGQFGKQVNGFRSRELSYLSLAINRMSQSLEDSDRQRRTQLAKARRIQRNLLPESPDMAGASFAVHYGPADDVAGDFYDVRRLADGSRVVLLADVTGHGIPAAMSATLLKAHFADACEHSTDVLQIMRHVNSRFTDLTLPEDFATAVLIRYVPESRILQVVNAGHDAVLYRPTEGRIREYPSSGLLLGVDADAEWSVESFEASSRDRLLVYTDGVTETFGSDKSMFGRDNVLALFEEMAALPPESALASMINTLDAFRGDGPQLDDVTAILIAF
jgi:sigma-B regulation protein RsbU (phosphoserine phosphatase)